MPATEDTPLSDAPGRSGSVTCKALLVAATPEMFRANAFRITGLPVDATMREITKHADRLKMMEELGQGKSLHTGAFALNTPPSVDQIRDAIQRLRDPEQRIIDEFFWFWPKQFGQSASDPAIKALEESNAKAALKIWTTLETSSSDGLVAIHNIAVLWLFIALDWENYYFKSDEFTEENRRQIEKNWRDAFKRWDWLAQDDLFWESMTLRIKQLDDPRLTSGFTRRMRATLPQALDKINAELAVRYAESGRMDLAQVHVQFMRESNQGLDNVEKTAELVLAPATTRLKQQIQRAEQRSAKNPTDAASAARELLDHARHTLALFELFLGKENETKNDLSDEVANLCNRLQVIYHKVNGDNKGCLELLRVTLPFATSIELRQQIEKNIGTLTGNIASRQLDPVYVILKVLQESTENSAVRLKRFKTEVVPAISTASSGIAGSEAHIELMDSAAIVLRAIANAAWNTHQDMVTALAATQLALEYARDNELKQRLDADETSLLQMASQHVTHNTTQQKSPDLNSIGCLVLLGILGIIALIDFFDSNKPLPKGHTQATPVATAPEYTPPSTSVGANKELAPVATPPKYTLPSVRQPSAFSTPTPFPTLPKSAYEAPDASIKALDGNHVYQIPNRYISELNSDEKILEYETAKSAALESRLKKIAEAVDSERAKAEEFQTQVDNLSDDLKFAQKYLDNTSQIAVDNFNRKVNRYNAALRDLRAKNEAVNDIVNSHNSLLEELRAQNIVVNRMVDAYNAKLVRYAR